MEAPGERVVRAFQQKRAVGEPDREAPTQGLGPPGRDHGVLDRPVALQPVEHHGAAALRRIGRARRAQIPQPGKALKLGEPVFAGAPVPPWRLILLADVAGADDLPAEVVDPCGQRLAAPGNARYQVGRPVQEFPVFPRACAVWRRGGASAAGHRESLPGPARPLRP